MNAGQSSPQNMLDENFRLQTSLLWWTYDWRLKHTGLLISFLKATAHLEPKTGREQIFVASLPASFLLAAVAPSSTPSIPAVFLPFNQQDDSSCLRSRGDSCVWGCTSEGVQEETTAFHTPCQLLSSLLLSLVLSIPKDNQSLSPSSAFAPECCSVATAIFASFIFCSPIQPVTPGFIIKR